MIGSKSKYFHQSPEALAEGRNKIVDYLRIWNYTLEEVCIYLKAYDYFCKNPNDFDGATIVKDLHHIPGLDINAMLHDYMYLIYNAAANLFVKWFCDYLYAKEMERLGKGGASWARFTGLKITGIPFAIYANFKRGSITQKQELEFWKDYKILMN